MKSKGEYDDIRSQTLTNNDAVQRCFFQKHLILTNSTMSGIELTLGVCRPLLVKVGFGQCSNQCWDDALQTIVNKRNIIIMP